MKKLRHALRRSAAAPKVIDFGMAMRMREEQSHASNFKQGTVRRRCVCTPLLLLFLACAARASGNEKGLQQDRLALQPSDK